ncbi:MAG: hypothetical protein JNG86_22930 [Verrucomicrobiaceae bacterium]|nr:hypothetical protein [Verrucomicrobiaceae bacterium]
MPARSQARLILGAVLFLLCASQSAAWMRPYRRDDLVLAEAELIVVARLKEGTLRRVERVYPKGQQGNSWDHTAVLIVTEVLKGEHKEKELPLILEYGLGPIVDGVMSKKRPNHPAGLVTCKGAVELEDFGDNFGGKVKGDIREDHLWFIRKASDDSRPANIYTRLSVEEPREVQHLEMKPYYLALMSVDVERRLKAIADESTAAGRRSLDVLDQMEVDRIVKIPNLAERAAKLMPFYAWTPPPDRRLPNVAGELIKCGPVVGDMLMPLYHAPPPHLDKWRIVSIWEAIRYTKGEPLMIEQLEKENQFWAGQRLKPEYPIHDDLRRLDLEGRQEASKSRMRKAINYLSLLGGERSVPVILETWRRWYVIDPMDGINRQCREAIAEIEGRGKTSGSTGKP